MVLEQRGGGRSCRMKLLRYFTGDLWEYEIVALLQKRVGGCGCSVLKDVSCVIPFLSRSAIYKYN